MKIQFSIYGHKQVRDSLNHRPYSVAYYFSRVFIVKYGNFSFFKIRINWAIAFVGTHSNHYNLMNK